MDTGNSLDGSVGRNPARVHPTNSTESVLLNETQTDVDEHVSKYSNSNTTAAAQMTRATELSAARRSSNQSSEGQDETHDESRTQDKADTKPYQEVDLGDDDDDDDNPSLLAQSSSEDDEGE